MGRLLDSTEEEVALTLPVLHSDWRDARHRLADPDFVRCIVQLNVLEVAAPYFAVRCI